MVEVPIRRDENGRNASTARVRWADFNLRLKLCGPSFRLPKQMEEGQGSNRDFCFLFSLRVHVFVWQARLAPNRHRSPGAQVRTLARYLQCASTFAKLHPPSPPHPPLTVCTYNLAMDGARIPLVPSEPPLTHLLTRLQLVRCFGPLFARSSAFHLLPTRLSHLNRSSRSVKTALSVTFSGKSGKKARLPNTLRVFSL